MPSHMHWVLVDVIDEVKRIKLTPERKLKQQKIMFGFHYKKDRHKIQIHFKDNHDNKI